MVRDRIRYGVIGMGRQGQRYIRHLLTEINDAELYAVTRAKAAQGAAAARSLGVHWADNWQRLIDDAMVDAVVICVPCSLHREIATAAMESGKHVILEKPLAPTLSDGKAIVDTALKVQTKGTLVFFAHTLRYSNVVAAVLKHKHRIGRLVSLNLSHRLEHKQLEWEHKKGSAGGGNILQTGVHMLDLVRFLTQDEVKRVSCIHGRVLEEEVEDRFTAIMETDGGIQATVEGSKFMRGRSGRIELVGPKGMLIGDHILNALALLNHAGFTPVHVGQPTMTVKKVLLEATRAFRGKKPVEITVVDGLASLAVADACYRSAQSGKQETVEY